MAKKRKDAVPSAVKYEMKPGQLACADDDVGGTATWALNVTALGAFSLPPLRMPQEANIGAHTALRHCLGSAIMLATGRLNSRHWARYVTAARN